LFSAEPDVREIAASARPVRRTLRPQDRQTWESAEGFSPFRLSYRHPGRLAAPLGNPWL